MADQQAAAPPAADARATAFEANVAKARAMSQATGSTPAAASAAKEPDASSDIASDDPEALPASGDADGSADAADAAADAGATPSEPVANPVHALELLTTGDLAGAIKALGGDPKLADTSDRKFAALREKENKIKRAEQAREQAHKRAVDELTKMSQAAQTQLNEFHRNNNFLNNGRKAVAEKNWTEVAKALEAFTGLPLSTLTQKLASGKTGPTPEEKRLEEDRAKFAREKAEFEAAKNKPNVEQQRATALQKVSEQLKDHPYLKVQKGFEARAKSRLEKTFSAWEKSWDGSKFTKTPAQCAAELHQDMLDEMKANGVKLGKSEPTKTKRGEPPPKVSSKGKDAVIDKASTFENRVAMAKRLSSIGNRN